MRIAFANIIQKNFSHSSFVTELSLTAIALLIFSVSLTAALAAFFSYVIFIFFSAAVTTASFFFTAISFFFIIITTVSFFFTAVAIASFFSVYYVLTESIATLILVIALMKALRISKFSSVFILILKFTSSRLAYDNLT